METQSRPVLIPLPSWSCTGTVVSSFWTTLEVRISLEHQLDDRLQQVGDDGHPVAHRRARQLDAEPLEDPFEAIKRQVIGILADRDVSQQPRAGQALLDRLGEPRRRSRRWPGRPGRRTWGGCVRARPATRGCIRVARGLPGRCRSARPPQSGQMRCSGGTSCRTGLRGRLAGSGLRPWPFFLGALAGRRGRGRLRGRGGRRRGLGLRQDLLGEEQELSRVDPLASSGRSAGGGAVRAGAGASR